MDRFSAHMDRAWDLLAKGETVSALVAAKKALEIDDESPEVHNLLGYIYAMDGDFEEAISNYRNAMSLDEWYIDPVLNTAELLVHPNADPQEAIRLCRNATEMVTGREELAEAILLEVDALLNLGCVEEARQRLDDIEEPELLPPTFAMLMGRALYEAGDPKAARIFIDRAIKHDPENGDAWYYAGQIAKDEGRRVDAVTAFRIVLAADLAAPSPPWTKYLEPTEPLVIQAISTLGDEERSLLAGTEVVIRDAPSLQQVQDEIDPRQVVFAEGIDPERRIFKRLWVFVRNLARAGVMPTSAITDLAEIIHREVGPEQDIV